MTEPARRPVDDDARFIARLADVYAPEPMGAARRAAFDARLGERLAAPRRPGWLLPALSTGLAVGLLSLATLWNAPVPNRAENLVAVEGVESIEAIESIDWEAELFYADADVERNHTAELPDEFIAISVAFLE